MLVTYTTPTPSARRKLHRRLYGYIDYSNNGRYKYERKGLLSRINHVKVNKATISVNDAEALIIINLFKKLGVEYKTF